MTIGERLKKARNDKKLTQKQLSEKLEVSLSIIGDIESGRRVASKKTSQRLADFFGTKVEYWFDEESIEDYFSNRPKYYALDKVITTLLDNNKLILTNGEPNEEVWKLIKKAITIDLNTMVIEQERD